MMYKLNDIPFEDYGILPGRVPGEGIAVKGIFDLPKRIGDIEHVWDDADGPEPFVEADEIFLAGRDIQFQGIIIGFESLINSYLTTFKSAISAFNNTVPFQTPYGTVCVLVKKHSVKHYNGGAIITIDFREPIVGDVCSVNTPGTLFLSAEYSDTATRNNCEDTHFGSEVTMTAVAGQFVSPVSQMAANQLAVDWVLENIQEYANINGVCTIKPTVYYNSKISGSLKKECDPGYEGTTVSYTVEAYKYQSLVSQADADAKAQNELDTTLTQAYANANGVCKLVYGNTLLEGQAQRQDCGNGNIGEIVTYRIPAGTFTSALSQAHANALAQADFNLNAQTYANTTGGCLFTPNPFRFKGIYADSAPDGVQQYLLTLNSTYGYIGNYVLQLKHQNGQTIKVTHRESTARAPKDVVGAVHAMINAITMYEWDMLVGGTMYDNPEHYPASSPFEVTMRYFSVYRPWRLEKVWLSV